MSKLPKRGDSKLARLITIIKSAPVSLSKVALDLGQKLRPPTIEDVKSLYVAITAIAFIIYTAYLDRKIYILTGLAFAVWYAFAAGVAINLLATIPILTITYLIIYRQILIWGAGRSGFVGRLFYFLFNFSAQSIISPIGAVLPPGGLIAGGFFWVAMAKFAPKVGNFQNRDRWLNGAKKSQYTVVKHEHQRYVKSLENEYGRVNKTMFLDIPLTDEEATTSFIVFGEVRSGKSLILSMLMQSLKE